VSSTTDAEVRAALRDKYQRMLALRAAEEAGEARDGLAIRALAAYYPGALRELDRAPLQILRGRLALLESPVTDALPDWAEPTLTWHRQLRWALEVRRAAGSDRCRDRARPVFAREHDHLGFRLAELETLMNPPGGRLSRWLLSRMASERGMATADLERLLVGHLMGHLSPGW
jgi:hypothetical protein